MDKPTTAEIRKRHVRDSAQWSYARHNLEAEKDRGILLEHISTLEAEKAELVKELSCVLSWVENWDSPFLEDDEWVTVDAPRIKALTKQEPE